MLRKLDCGCHAFRRRCDSNTLGSSLSMRSLKLSLCAAAVFGLPGLSSDAQAQNFPNRTITLVIPFTPGGSNTIVGRAVADKMRELLGEKIVVDNRPGAGG